MLKSRCFIGRFVGATAIHFVGLRGFLQRTAVFIR